jgi:hypothetical protein
MLFGGTRLQTRSSFVLNVVAKGDTGLILHTCIDWGPLAPTSSTNGFWIICLGG